MKKLFAIIAGALVALAMASCGNDNYDVMGAHQPEDIPVKNTPPEPESKEPEQGFKGAVVGGEFKKVTNEYWPSVKFVENDEGTQSHGGNLRPLAIWEQSFNGKVFTLNDTEAEATRFLRVEKDKLNDCGYEIDTDTLRVGFMAGTPDAILTNDIAIQFNVERRYGWIVVGGKYEPLDNGLNKYEYVIDADVIGEDTIFMGDEAYLREEVELTLKMKVTNAYYTDEDVIHIFIDRKIVLPEKEEPVVEEPEPDPVVETPVVEEPVAPKIDFEITGLKSFIAWTMVMDINDKFHDCLFFDCGDRWAAVVDKQEPIYFVKSCVIGDEYNSLNWDNVDNCWVPAHAYSTGSESWNYDTVLASGDYIDRGSLATYATNKDNNNFFKDDHAKTTWKVNANANPSEYNGKVVITITAHKYVINEDYKIVIIEK